MEDTFFVSEASPELIQLPEGCSVVSIENGESKPLLEAMYLWKSVSILLDGKVLAEVEGKPLGESMRKRKEP